MYKALIGNAEYGPVDPDTLQRWGREGRIGPNTIILNIASRERTPAHQLELLQGIVGARPAPAETVGSKGAASAASVVATANAEAESSAAASGFFGRPGKTGGVVAVVTLLIAGLIFLTSGNRDVQSDTVSAAQVDSAHTFQAANTGEPTQAIEAPPVAVVAAQVIPHAPVAPTAAMGISSANLQPQQVTPVPQSTDDVFLANLSSNASMFGRKVAQEWRRSVVYVATATRRFRPTTQRMDIKVAPLPVEPAKDPEKEEEQWRQVLVVTGQHPTSTDPFTIEGSRWRIRWRTTADLPEDNFRLAVHRTEVRYEVLADVIGGTRDATVRHDKGKFYLSVNTEQTFRIVVEELVSGETDQEKK